MIRKTLIPLFLILLLPVVALPQQENDYESRRNYYRTLLHAGKIDEAISELKMLIEIAPEDDKVILKKDLGDLYAVKEDIPAAAAQYAEVLKIKQDFPFSERYKMAKWMSWAGMYKEAIETFNYLLDEDWEDKDVRLSLARTMAWKGDLVDALKESEILIARYPDDLEVWQLNADILRWNGNQKDAIRIYKEILSKDPANFNARLGIAYSYLWSGDVISASDIADDLYSLQPENKDVSALRDFVREKTHSSIEMGFGMYDDTDYNSLNTYMLGYEFTPFTLAKLIRRTRVEYKQISGMNQSLDNSASLFNLTLFTSLRDSADLKISAAIVSLDRNKRGSISHPVWVFRVNKNISKWLIRFIASQSYMLDTAQLIENDIGMTTLGIGIEKILNARFILLADFKYRSYSDNNSANDITLSPRIVLKKFPSGVQLGYRFKWLDFEEQSGSGYFDPGNFQSHQIVAILYGEKERINYYIEAFVGQQYFDRYMINSSDSIMGASGLIGYKLSKKVTAEIHGEAGNYAVQATGGRGFKMWTAGSKIKVTLD